MLFRYAVLRINHTKNINIIYAEVGRCYIVLEKMRITANKSREKDI